MAAGGGIHAAGEGLRGYLLLHSAFGPSSTQLREKTEPGRGGETQNTGEEAVQRARALRWAGEERQAERLGAGPAPQGAPSCPPLLQRPQEEPLMSVCPEEPREQGGALIHLCFSSLGRSPGGSADKACEDYNLFPAPSPLHWAQYPCGQRPMCACTVVSGSL